MGQQLDLDDYAALCGSPLPRWLRWPIFLEGSCWISHKRPNSEGYIQVKNAQQTFRAHRLSYQLHVGPIHAGKELDHLCRRRNCLNPAHLEIVTTRENVLRGEGPTARHARQTHCIHGHKFDKANTHIRKNGGRHCRACDNLHTRYAYRNNPEHHRAIKRNSMVRVRNRAATAVAPPWD